jgi:hypothetical protein
MNNENSNNGNSGVIDMGGSLKIQMSNPEEHSNPAFDDRLRSGVSNGASFRADEQGNVTEFGGIVRATVNNTPAPDAEPLDSIRTPSGAMPRGAITSDYRISFPGFGETTVGAARSMGWLRFEGDRPVITGRHVGEIEALRNTR